MRASYNKAAYEQPYAFGMSSDLPIASDELAQNLHRCAGSHQRTRTDVQTCTRFSQVHLEQQRESKMA